jgi:hypothetical protein
MGRDAMGRNGMALSHSNTWLGTASLKYAWGRNMVDFDYSKSGHLQMLYVESKYSTYVLASTKLGQQAWGCNLLLLTNDDEYVPHVESWY